MKIQRPVSGEVGLEWSENRLERNTRGQSRARLSNSRARLRVNDAPSEAGSKLERETGDVAPSTNQRVELIYRLG